MYRFMTAEFTEASYSVSAIAVVKFLQLNDLFTPTIDFPAVLLPYLYTFFAPKGFKCKINLSCNFILLEQIFSSYVT